MADLKIFKEVHSLPDSLQPNAIYCIRVGSGFDLYVSDATGQVAHKVNSEAINEKLLERIKTTESRDYIKNSDGKPTILTSNPLIENCSISMNSNGEIAYTSNGLNSKYYFADTNLDTLLPGFYLLIGKYTTSRSSGNNQTVLANLSMMDCTGTRRDITTVELRGVADSLTSFATYFEITTETAINTLSISSSVDFPFTINFKNLHLTDASLSDIIDLRLVKDKLNLLEDKVNQLVELSNIASHIKAKYSERENLMAFDPTSEVPFYVKGSYLNGSLYQENITVNKDAKQVTLKTGDGVGAYYFLPEAYNGNILREGDYKLYLSVVNDGGDLIFRVGNYVNASWDSQSIIIPPNTTDTYEVPFTIKEGAKGYFLALVSSANKTVTISSVKLFYIPSLLPSGLATSSDNDNELLAQRIDTLVSEVGNSKLSLAEIKSKIESLPASENLARVSEIPNLQTKLENLNKTVTALPSIEKLKNEDGSVAFSIERNYETNKKSKFILSKYQRVPFDDPVIQFNKGGGTWDKANSAYVIPKDGNYIIKTSYRLIDNAPSVNVWANASLNGNVADGKWQSNTGLKFVGDNIRFAYLTKGTRVQMYMNATNYMGASASVEIWDTVLTVMLIPGATVGILESAGVGSEKLKGIESNINSLKDRITSLSTNVSNDKAETKKSVSDLRDSIYSTYMVQEGGNVLKNNPNSITTFPYSVKNGSDEPQISQPIISNNGVITPVYLNVPQLTATIMIGEGELSSLLTPRSNNDKIRLKMYINCDLVSSTEYRDDPSIKHAFGSLSFMLDEDELTSIDLNEGLNIKSTEFNFELDYLGTIKIVLTLHNYRQLTLRNLYLGYPNPPPSVLDEIDMIKQRLDKLEKKR